VRFTKAFGASVLIASLVGGLGSYLMSTRTAAAQEKRGDFAKDYKMDARIEMVSDNDLSYPTLFGRAPTKGEETVLGVVEIEHGRMGATTLDGTVFGFYGVGSRTAKEKPFKVLSVYLDEKSSSLEQRNAIGSIIYNDARFQADKLNTLSTTKIEIVRGSEKDKEKEKTPLSPITVKLGDRGNFTITPSKGGDGINPVTIGNASTMFLERDPVAVGIGNGSFKDYGHEVNFVNTAAEIHYVRIEGSAAEKTKVER
jgi:hypothetical protein